MTDKWDAYEDVTPLPTEVKPVPFKGTRPQYNPVQPVQQEIQPGDKRDRLGRSQWQGPSDSGPWAGFENVDVKPSNIAIMSADDTLPDFHAPFLDEELKARMEAARSPTRAKGIWKEDQKKNAPVPKTPEQIAVFNVLYADSKELAEMTEESREWVLETRSIPEKLAQFELADQIDFYTEDPGRLERSKSDATKLGKAMTQYMPIGKDIFDASQLAYVHAAAQRVESGKYTPDDVDAVAKYVAGIHIHEKKYKAAGQWGRALIGLKEMPAFVGSFALTGGGFKVGQTAAKSAVRKMMSDRVAKSLGGRAIQATAGGLAGTAVQTAANPAMVARSTMQQASQRAIGNIGSDEKRPAGILGNIPAGIADTAIEIGSEHMGGALPFGRWLGKGGKSLSKLGIHNPVSEYLEERWGDAARGALGSATEMFDGDSGVLGDFLSGDANRIDRAVEQSKTELLMFSAMGGPSMAGGAVGWARNTAGNAIDAANSVFKDAEEARRAVVSQKLSRKQWKGLTRKPKSEMPKTAEERFQDPVAQYVLRKAELIKAEPAKADLGTKPVDITRPTTRAELVRQGSVKPRKESSETGLPTKREEQDESYERTLSNEDFAWSYLETPESRAVAQRIVDGKKWTPRDLVAADPELGAATQVSVQARRAFYNNLKEVLQNEDLGPAKAAGFASDVRPDGQWRMVSPDVASQLPTTPGLESRRVGRSTFVRYSIPDGSSPARDSLVKRGLDEDVARNVLTDREVDIIVRQAKRISGTNPDTGKSGMGSGSPRENFLADKIAVINEQAQDAEASPMEGSESVADPLDTADSIPRVSNDEFADGPWDMAHAGLMSEIVADKVAKGMKGIENRIYGIREHSPGEWQMVSRPDVPVDPGGSGSVVADPLDPVLPVNEMSDDIPERGAGQTAEAPFKMTGEPAPVKEQPPGFEDQGGRQRGLFGKQDDLPGQETFFPEPGAAPSLQERQDTAQADLPSVETVGQPGSTNLQMDLRNYGWRDSSEKNQSEIDGLRDRLEQLSPTKVKDLAAAFGFRNPEQAGTADKAVNSIINYIHPVETASEPLVESPAPASKAKQLPSVASVKDNFRTPLSNYTDNLYHETSAPNALIFMPKGNVSTDMREVFVANTENLALGQGKGKGVRLEFRPGNIEGTINKDKPGWELAFEAGEAEFKVRISNQKQWQNSLASVTVAADAKLSKSDKTRLARALNGWTSKMQPDGSTRYTPQDAAAPGQKMPPSTPELGDLSGDERAIYDAIQAEMNPLAPTKVVRPPKPTGKAKPKTKAKPKSKAKPKPKSAKAQARAELADAYSELAEALKDLDSTTPTLVPLTPEITKALAKVAVALAKNGVVEFAEFVKGVATQFSPDLARRIGEQIETAWKMLKLTGKFDRLGEVGSTSDVLDRLAADAKPAPASVPAVAQEPGTYDPDLNEQVVALGGSIDAVRIDENGKRKTGLTPEQRKFRASVANKIGSISDPDLDDAIAEAALQIASEGKFDKNQLLAPYAARVARSRYADIKNPGRERTNVEATEPVAPPEKLLQEELDQDQRVEADEADEQIRRESQKLASLTPNAIGRMKLSVLREQKKIAARVATAAENEKNDLSVDADLRKAAQKLQRVTTKESIRDALQDFVREIQVAIGQDVDPLPVQPVGISPRQDWEKKEGTGKLKVAKVSNDGQKITDTFGNTYTPNELVRDYRLSDEDQKARKQPESEPVPGVAQGATYHRKRVKKELTKAFGAESAKANMVVLDSFASTRTGAAVAEFWRTLTIRSGSVEGLSEFEGALFQNGVKPVWYSKLQNVIEEKIGGKVGFNQLMATLKKNGVSPSEMKWSNLEVLFEDRKSVPKAELQDWVAANGVKLEETVLGGAGEGDTRDEITETAMNTAREMLARSSGGLTAEAEALADRWLADTDDIDAYDQFDDILREATGERLDWVLEEAVENRPETGGRTKYEKWTLKGGKNYREVLVQLPQRSQSADSERTKELDDEIRAISHWPGDPQRAQRAEQQGQLDALLTEWEQIDGTEAREFTSSHWDQPNVVVHIRMSDRIVNKKVWRGVNRRSGNPGPDFDSKEAAQKWVDALPESMQGKIHVQSATVKKKVLHIEEIQSDWHQKGRKKGYAVGLSKDESAELDALNEQNAQLFGDMKAAVKDNNDTRSNSLYDKRLPVIARIRELEKKRDAKDGVPDAPFKKSWHELAMKRVFQEAVDGGYDSIVITPGKEQAKRYDLSQQVDSIEWRPTHKSVPFKTVVSIAMAGESEHAGVDFTVSESGEVGSLGDRSDSFDGKQLDDVVGKEVAKKIMADPRGKLSGAGLSIGGEGMVGFYDQIIPRFVRKYGKKWGLFVEPGKVEVTDAEAEWNPQYVGPPKTISEVTEALADPDIKWPSTKESIGQILANMARGQSFKVSMEKYANSKTAEIFGGELTFKKVGVDVHSITVTDAMRADIGSKGQPLFQSQESGPPMGAFQWDGTEQGQRIITAFETGNVRTLIHELGHLFRSWLTEEEQLTVDIEMGIAFKKGTQISYPNGEQWTRENEEDFTEQLEQFVVSGPTNTLSEGLTAVFQKIRKWLGQIYKHLDDHKAIALTPKMTTFFRDLFGGKQSTEKGAQTRAAGLKGVAVNKRNREQVVIDEIVKLYSDEFTDNEVRGALEQAVGTLMEEYETNKLRFETVPKETQKRLRDEENFEDAKAWKIDAVDWLHLFGGGGAGSFGTANMSDDAKGKAQDAAAKFFREQPVEGPVEPTFESEDVRKSAEGLLDLWQKVGAPDQAADAVDEPWFDGSTTPEQGEMPEIDDTMAATEEWNEEWNDVSFEFGANAAEAADVERERESDETVGLGFGPSGEKPRNREDKLPAEETIKPDEVLKRWGYTEEQQKRSKQAHGVVPPSAGSKAKTLLTKLGHRLTRAQEHVPLGDRFAVFREFFRKLKDNYTIASSGTNTRIAAITDELGPTHLAAFESYLDLRNKRSAFEGGQAFGRHGFASQEEVEDRLRAAEKDIRFGRLMSLLNSGKSLKDAQATVDEETPSTAPIRRALLKREMERRTIVSEMVELGLLKDDALENDQYFHQQVFSRMYSASVTAGRTAQRKTRSFQKKRVADTGTAWDEELDYNLSYIQAESAWMTEARVEIRKEKLLRALPNQMQRLKDEAKETNYRNLVGGQKNVDKLKKLREELATARENKSPDGGEKAHMKQLSEQIWDLDPSMPYRAQTAAAISMFEKAWGKVGDNLMKDLKQAADSPVDTEGRLQARLVFRAMQQQAAFIRETLAAKFETWETLLRNDPTLASWQAVPGNVFYQVYTIPEHIAMALMKKEMESQDIDPDQIRKVAVQAGQREPMILPVEVVTELDQMDRSADDARDFTMSSLREAMLTRWKVYTLMNPKKFLAYRARNMTGDLDAVLTGAPGALKFTGRAMKELAAYYRGKKLSMSPELKLALEGGVIGGSMNSTDLPNLKEIAEFRRFFEKDPSAWGRVKGLVGGYMNIVSKFNNWNEEVLRYAAFLHYQKHLKNGTLKHYGGSRRGTVDTLAKEMGTDVAAAHLARNLLGDYGNLTVMGQHMRRYHMPFWSYQEINLKRVPLLVANAFTRGKTGAKVGAVAAIPTWALRIMIQSRIATLSAAVLAWNAWGSPFFDDDDDEDRKKQERNNPVYAKQNLHINLGYTDDGSVVTFNNVGMLGDFGEWFGLQLVPELYRQYNDGQVTEAQVLEKMLFESPTNKAVQALSPYYKMIPEVGLGESPFPDWRNWRPVNRDEAFFGTFGLTDEYKWLRGQVTKDGSRARPGYRVRFFGVGVSDPRRTALSMVWNVRERFLESKGKAAYNPQKVSEFKQLRDAGYFDDFQAFKDAKVKYVENGGTYKRFEGMLDGLMPGVKKEFEDEFIEFMNVEQKERYDTAKEYAGVLRTKLFIWWKTAGESGYSNNKELNAKIGQLAKTAASGGGRSDRAKKAQLDLRDLGISPTAQRRYMREYERRRKP